MDMMEIRHRMLMKPTKSGPVDTSPRIAEYGVFWNRTQDGKTANSNWCITELYTFEQQENKDRTLVGKIGVDATTHTFMYYGTRNSVEYKNWNYFNSGGGEGTKNLASAGGTITVRTITFSIQQDMIDDSYVYVTQTGQIFFAGINTPYYGYTNISDIPT